MTDCAVTLALAYGSSQPYVSQHLRLAPVTGFVDGTFWVTTDFEEIPLTNPPGVVNLEQGQTYAFVEPNGDQVFKEIPALASADYADIDSTSGPLPSPVSLIDSAIDLVLSRQDSQSRSRLQHLFVRVLDTDGDEITDGVVTLTVERPMGNRIKNISFEED